MKPMKRNHRKLFSRMAALITVLCMVFTMLPITALAFNPDWYKTHIKSVSIGKPTTDLNGKKYLPVTVFFTAEEDIGDSNAVYFLEGYLLATLKNGQKAEGIEGNGMTLIGPLKPDALDVMGSNAYSWNWKGWEEGGEGVLKYNIPLLEDSDTQTVEQSPYTGQQEVNGLKVGDEVSFKIETVMNTNTIPAAILPEGGSLMSDEFYNRGNKSQRLIINKISKKVIGEALVANLDEIIDKVGVQLIGVIPDDFKMTVATGKGTPIPTDSEALKAFDAISKRLGGEFVPLTVKTS